MSTLIGLDSGRFEEYFTSHGHAKRDGDRRTSGSGHDGNVMVLFLLVRLYLPTPGVAGGT
jgi:hypothetical protein